LGIVAGVKSPWGGEGDGAVDGVGRIVCQGAGGGWANDALPRQSRVRTRASLRMQVLGSREVEREHRNIIFLDGA
jgi:hypothetical protein